MAATTSTRFLQLALLGTLGAGTHVRAATDVYVLCEYPTTDTTCTGTPVDDTSCITMTAGETTACITGASGTAANYFKFTVGATGTPVTGQVFTAAGCAVEDKFGDPFLAGSCSMFTSLLSGSTALETVSWRFGIQKGAETLATTTTTETTTTWSTSVVKETVTSAIPTTVTVTTTVAAGSTGGAAAGAVLLLPCDVANVKCKEYRRDPKSKKNSVMRCKFNAVWSTNYPCTKEHCCRKD